MITRVAVAALFVAGAQAGAQLTRSAGPDMLPRELVESLIMMPFGGMSTEFTVGSLPRGLDASVYVPRNARVVGGMITGLGTFGVISIPLPTDSIAAMYRREEPRLGWQPFTRGNMTGGSWGFRAAAGSTGDQLIFCKNRESMVFAPTAKGPRETSLLVIAFGAMGDQCVADPAARPERTTTPTLYNPPNAEAMGMDCQVASMSMTGTSTRLHTPSAPSEILAHYARQLADSGWKPRTGGAPAIGTWIHADPDGVTRELKLTVIPGTSPQCATVSMDVSTMRRP